MRILLLNQISKAITIALFLFSFLGLHSYSALAAEESDYKYTVDMAFDKEKVSEADTFTLNFTLKNTGTTPIPNVEIRVPFYNTIQNIKSTSEDSTFNKLLNDGEYPSGFNSRSWLVNSLAVGSTRNFSIKYTLADTVPILESKFTLPASWSDPGGLESSKALNLNYARSDVYIQGIYESSLKKTLPAIDSIANKVTGIRLNNKYYFSGSKTTDFKNIKDSNIKAFSPFILDTADITIEWSEPIDFSSEGTLDKLKKLDTFLKVEWGKVEFNSKELLFLLKPAKITFKNLNFVNPPKVKVENNILPISDLSASFDVSTKTLNVTHGEKVKTTVVSPDLIFENGVIQTSESNITIKGKTIDPKTPVKYKIDSSPEVTVNEIDLSTGEFEIPITDSQKVTKVTVTTSLKNNESLDKIVLIKYSDKDGEENAAATTSPDKVSLPWNPITIALMLVAGGILLLIVGFVYFLYFRRKKFQKRGLSFSQLRGEKDVAKANASDSITLLKDE